MAKCVSKCKYTAVLVMIVAGAMTAGCATVGDQRVDILYRSSANATGGSGDLYLVQEAQAPSGGTTPIQWIIGDITNKDGEKVANIVTDMAPADLLASAFDQELKTAGYNVLHVDSMPGDAVKGLDLKSVSIKMEEKKSLIEVNATCRVKISVEPWRNGKAVNKLDYEAEYTDSSVTDRDEIVSKTMAKALQTIMARSVPDIIKTLEQQ